MARFPPRSSLPRTIAIEKVPFLGTTWYERGARYWLRRVLMVICGAAVLALIFSAFWGLFAGIRQSSEIGFRIALVVEIVYSLATITYAVVRAKRRWNVRDVEQQRFRLPAAPLARVGYVVGQTLLGLAIVLSAGLYVSIFIAMLTPETVFERPTRLRMADLLQRRGL